MKEKKSEKRKAEGKRGEKVRCMEIEAGEVEQEKKRRRGRPTGYRFPERPPASVVEQQPQPQLVFLDHVGEPKAQCIAKRKRGQQPESLTTQLHTLALAILVRNAGKLPEVVRRSFVLVAVMQK